MTVVRLPGPEGSSDYDLGRHPVVSPPHGYRPRSRVVYAAAHVVATEVSDRVDWDTTLAFRRHLWSLGFGVADAMDTAQRGMGLEVDQVRELIRRSAKDKPDDARLVCGVNTDELVGDDHDLDSIVASYLDQLGFVEDVGADAVIMASRVLAATASGPDDYAQVYDRVLTEVTRPVILHWLGPMFDPQLEGYWGSTDPGEAMTEMMAVIADNPSNVDGVKISMLDEELELALRCLLPEGVRCYTGDDFNYPSLIKGYGSQYSDALLGIFDGIAPVAAAALAGLDDGDLERYDRLMEPTVPLSRHIFTNPTYHYKTGLVFLAYLNGHHDHFRMLDGQETARSPEHLGEIVRLADRAGLFADPDDVARRVTDVFESL